MGGNKKAERAGIEPATAGFIRLLLVLKTRWDTSPVPSIICQALSCSINCALEPGKYFVILMQKYHFFCLRFTSGTNFIKIESAFNFVAIGICCIPDHRIITW